MKTGKQFDKIVSQKIVKDSFNALFIAAGKRNNFAFIRYSFGTSDDIWDREMNIKHNYNANSAPKLPDNDGGTEYDEYNLNSRTIVTRRAD